MRPARLHRLLHRHLAWLLALLLLLPLAQTAASWHLLSQVHTGQSAPSGDDHTIHESHCALCLNAAALTGGALPVQSMATLPIVAPAQAQEVPRAPARLARLQRPYQSRAPPFVPV